MCFKTIDYTVDEKINEGWMEWNINPSPYVYVCSLECYCEWDMS